jgi:hypothetical protein
MKNLMTMLLSGVALVIAGNAFAEPVVTLPGEGGGGDDASVTINGKVAPQCKVTGATSARITGGGTAGLAQADGTLATSVSADIQNALNTTGTEAWCSGIAKVVVSRTPLVRQGTNGAIDTSGFVNAIGYDVAVKIAGATRTSAFPGYDDQDGSSDGAGNGPTFNPFGPSGNGSAITFIADTWANPEGVFTTAAPLDLAVATTFDGKSQTLLSSVAPAGTRLAAGDYVGTVTLTLTPTT